MNDRLTSRHEQELRDLDPAEHPDIAALLSKIDGQRSVIRGKDAKIERQQKQLRTKNDQVVERNRTIAAQDKVIREQADEIQRLREQLGLQKDPSADIRTHFTAWLVNDPSALDQGCMDVTILEDELIGADPEDDGAWSTDTSKPTAFYAVTAVDARDGDAEDGCGEAEDLMRAAGWRTVGNWESVDNAYIVTVERDA